MNSFRVALLGTSHWHAQMYLDAVKACGASISVAWDTDPGHADYFARRFEVPHERDLDAALAKADLAILMGHPCDVPALALRVFASGVPCVLEKPAVSSTDELARLCEAAVNANAFVAVPLANRLGPAMQELQYLRAAGESGEVRHASFRLINGPPQRYRDDGVSWVLDPAIGGGGALRNLGIHGIDCAIALSQGPLQVVSSQIAKRIHLDEAVEDHALVVLTDDRGALFVIEAGYTFASMAPGGDFEWRLTTNEATLIDRGDFAVAYVLATQTVRELSPQPASSRYRHFIADTLSRLAARRGPAVSLKDYLDAMRLIDEAYRRGAL